MSKLAYYYNMANELYLRIEKVRLDGTVLTYDIRELETQFCILVAFWMAELGDVNDPYNPYESLMGTTEGTMFEKCRCAMYS